MVTVYMCITRFSGLLLLSALIGVYSAIKSKKMQSTENYYFGNRKMPSVCFRIFFWNMFCVLLLSHKIIIGFVNQISKDPIWPKTFTRVFASCSAPKLLTPIFILTLQIETLLSILGLSLVQICLDWPDLSDCPDYPDLSWLDLTCPDRWRLDIPSQNVECVEAWRIWPSNVGVGLMAVKSINFCIWLDFRLGFSPSTISNS